MIIWDDFFRAGLVCYSFKMSRRSTLESFGENFKAFDRKLVKICKYRFSSPQIFLKGALCLWIWGGIRLRVMFFSSAWWFKRAKAFSTVLNKSKSISTRRKVFRSTYARSSKSVISTFESVLEASRALNFFPRLLHFSRDEFCFSIKNELIFLISLLLWWQIPGLKSL